MRGWAKAESAQVSLNKTSAPSTLDSLLLDADVIFYLESPGIHI